MVEAGGTAGRERVTEPEPGLGGLRVRQVGEGRRALVRGDDEVRVVHHRVTTVSRGWRTPSSDDVVGDVEQAAHEDPVAATELERRGIRVAARPGAPSRRRRPWLPPGRSGSSSPAAPSPGRAPRRGSPPAGPTSAARPGRSTPYRTCRPSTSGWCTKVSTTAPVRLEERHPRRDQLDRRSVPAWASSTSGSSSYAVTPARKPAIPPQHPVLVAGGRARAVTSSDPSSWLPARSTSGRSASLEELDPAADERRDAGAGCPGRTPCSAPSPAWCR